MFGPDQDLGYVPGLETWVDAADAMGARRVLLIGVDADPSIDRVIRRAQVPSINLPTGAYFFRIEGHWAALVVETAIARGQVVGGRFDRLEENVPLVMGRRWFEALWDGAVPVGPKAAFAAGTPVRILGSDDLAETVGEGTRQGDTFVYSVRVASVPGVRSVFEHGLAAADLETDDVEEWLSHAPVSAEEIALRLTCVKLTSPLSDTIYSYGASKTVFRAYQFKPVLRLLASPSKRLLIADEVGLGKTIEAGLVWTELEQRAPLRRVLIVCPAMLVSKWRDEMRRRFGRTLRVLDRQGLEDLVELSRRDDAESPFAGVVSLERLRTSELLGPLAESAPSFDLVIVDEAHYMRNAGTLSHDLGQFLSDWADALLFLSATPLNLGQTDLFNLVNLLVPSEFVDLAVFAEQLAPNRLLTEAGRRLRERPEDPGRVLEALRGLADLRFGAGVLARPEFQRLRTMLSARQPLSARDVAQAKRLLAELHTLSTIITRTRKADVPEARARREAMPINVDWTDEERQFYEAVRVWVVAKARARGLPPGFATQMPLRQTASCIPAMLAKLDEVDAALQDDVDTEGTESGIGPEWDQDVLDELASVVGVAARRVRGTDTKFDQFAAELADARAHGIQQVMVFSFFRRTLAYLATRLSKDYRVGVMHGGVPVDRREDIMRAFRAGGIEVLLLSEVGSEGLDFEFCNVLVNYDLPWNPMRVEQRIGRVDRFGQTSEKIFIYNFHVPGTIETDIFDRLYERLRIFEESVGELEPVLRDEFADLERVVLDPRLSEEERRQELRRVEVAFEERSSQVEDIRAAEGQLTGLDQLVIDGFEDDLDRGRYVGPSEIRRLLEVLLAETGARLELAADGLTGRLIGTSRLSRQLLLSQRTAGASSFGLSELSRRLNDEEPIAVTFDSDHASRTGDELLSVRHPLLLTALDHLSRGNRLRMARFGRLRIEGMKGTTACMVLYLLEVTGLRPTLEFLPVAVTVPSLEPRPDLGDALLGALARGELREEPGPVPDLRAAVVAARSQAFTEMAAIEAARRRANEYFVDSQLAVVRADIAHKVSRARDQLSRVSEARVRRLHEGRIRNLLADEERRLAEIDAKRELTVTLRPVAVLSVTG